MLTNFRVSPEILIPLGAEQLQDPALAVLELIKNSWDADAKNVSVRIEKAPAPAIVVEDDGHGMTEAVFVDRWLVIGASAKRRRAKTDRDRPVIGEKGLGRLASAALGNTVTVRSRAEGEAGFLATVNWSELRAKRSIEDYKIELNPESRGTLGTEIRIEALRVDWTEQHTNYLTVHTEFLTAVPGQEFNVVLAVGDDEIYLGDPLERIRSTAEATMQMVVTASGAPSIASCFVDDADASLCAFRAMPQRELDNRLAGASLSLWFFRRDEAGRRIGLATNEVSNLLDRYQGVRVFRDGINVPPYGIDGDDWASLEKQRTRTGGPTLTPGNSQLVGELHVSRESHPHLVITGSRSGFADQSATASLANYVRWAVRELGTARRAKALGLLKQSDSVPPRVGRPQATEKTLDDAREAMSSLERSINESRNAELKEELLRARMAIDSAMDRSEELLRLYAQLASSGIAATSFAHELRGDFDVVTGAVREITERPDEVDEELAALLSSSWTHIRTFAGLFKVLPVKQRRRKSEVARSQILESIETIAQLAQGQRIQVDIYVDELSVNLVLAEFDSICLNLVSNAIKAIGESTRRSNGMMKITATRIDDGLRLSVLDNGCGISPEVKAVLFEPLEGRFAEGTGMGLAIVKFLAERYKGSVFTRDADAPYVTEFTVSLTCAARLR